MNRVVVDASIALRWVLRDEKEERVDALLEEWMTSLTEMIVPPLFRAEITNALYLSSKRGRIASSEAKLALETILESRIKTIEPPVLYSRSLELATRYNLTQAYDAQYLALADIEGCEFWTADKRLIASLRPLPSWLKPI